MLLKKVINQYKFNRVKNNKRTFLCNTYSSVHGKVYGLFLDNHLYIALNKGLYPHLRWEYYAYFVGEIGGVHYRADAMMFSKIQLMNSI